MTKQKNPVLAELIRELKKSSIDNGVGIWKRVAEDLEKPRKQDDNFKGASKQNSSDTF